MKLLEYRKEDAVSMQVLETDRFLTIETDAIEPEIQSELERALSGETVLPEKILDTDWGNIFIAYYPLHNESGEVVGALGIEVAADIEAEAVHDKSIIQRHGKY